MRAFESIKMAAVVVAVLCSVDSVWAQRRGGGQPRMPKQAPHQQQTREPKNAASGPRPVEEFMQMSPAEREKELQKLPPERQEKLRQQLQRYDQASPEQKARLQRLWALPPAQRQQVRQSMTDFSQQPQDRKQAMRRQLNQVQAMSPDERTSYFNSPDFKSQYSPEEQDMMKNLSTILPPQPKQ